MKTRDGHLVILKYRLLSFVIWVMMAGGTILLPGCQATFNFTGVPNNVSDGLETIAIETFGNQADIIVPYLAQEFTNQLQDRFLSQSRLNLTTGSADVNVSGAITRYFVSPVAISGGEIAEQNRLTMGVRVKYENNVTPEDSWEQTFTSFVDFSAQLDLAAVERELIDQLIEQLSQDIFNKSLGKW